MLNHEALRAALTGIFGALKGEEIEPQLAARHVPVAYVRNLGQVLEHPHFKERDIFLEAELPGTERPLKTVGPGFQLGSGRFTAGAVPRLGEHTEEVLAELELDPEVLAAVRPREAA